MAGRRRPGRRYMRAHAHLRSSGLGVTPVMGLDQVLTVGWLALLGVTLRNPAVFVAAAVTVGALNMIIQLSEASPTPTTGR